MAITRKAKNYKVRVVNNYKAITGGVYYKTANRIIIDAVKGNLNLHSNKKIIGNGGV